MEGDEAANGPQKRPGYAKFIIIGVVVAAAVVAVVIAPPFIVQWIGQPNMVMTEVTVTILGGEFCSDDYIYFFSIVNSGDADGIATVEYLIDGAVRDTQDYFVPAGTSIDRSFDVPVDDCETHTAAVRTGSVTKG